MFTVVLFVFVAKIANYVWPEAIRFPNIAHWVSHEYHGVATWYDDQSLFHSCAAGQRMADVQGGYVCTSGRDASPEGHAFDSAPLSGGAREAIYAAIASGSVAGATDLLAGRVDVPRYEPAPIDGSDAWRSDPYHASYWRFYYYSLRPTVSLLTAYNQSGDHKYINKLLAIDDSFFGAEASSPYAWRDDHAVAFRAMVLTYEWWELRRLHLLSAQESGAFLRELARTGNFLADPNHYQPEMNHGTNESAALLQMGVDFPDLPGAATWLSTARTRLAQSLDLLFDQDGVLIENSPYYHFYELDKYWQIYQFSLATQVLISKEFPSRLRDMTNYAAYILQPNGTVPLLGASLEATIRDHGSFAALAQANPNLQYVLSQGRSGTPPEHTSVFFPGSGQTVMRSAWGAGSQFRDAAYLTFNVGAYRTAHSDLDALGFTLYDNGATLMPGPGLYTFSHGAMRDYFHGTASHNTVVVDRRDQQQGSAAAGPLVRRGGITYQSGFSPLYDGVRHLRTLMMIDKDHFLVIDRLSSWHMHTYEQMFHLFPGARLKQTGLTVTGTGATPQQSVTIQQLNPAGIRLNTTIGQTLPPMGLCSTRYQTWEPCYALAYTQRARDAAYTTLLSVGPPDPRFSVSFDRARSRLVVHDHGRVLRIGLGISAGRDQWTHATDPKPPAPVTRSIQRMLPWANWNVTGPGYASIMTASDDSGKRVLRLAATTDTESATDSAVRPDLSTSNLQIRIKLNNAPRIRSLTLGLSDNSWSSAARVDLREAYNARYSGEWMTTSLGRDSSLSGVRGHWQIQGAFDWRAIDAVRLTMSARSGAGPTPSVELDSIRAVPEQRTGAVALIFDDAYESTMPAARALHDMKMPASVAVIGKYAELPTYGHLNLYELRMLQNQWGWNMVNHTQDHVDAVSTYYSRSALGAYQQDILDGATFLEREGLNTAPNWLIYPHGATNAALDKVVARFYKFARTTDPGPEAYPYGSPLRVKSLLVTYPGDVEGSISHTATPPAQIIAAARDARKYHTTLLLTFHRIKALGTDMFGYPIADFRQVVRGLKRLRIPVMTLSQLDAMDGVPQDNRIIVRPAIAPLTTVAITDQTAGPQGAKLPFWPIGAVLALIGCASSLAVLRRARKRR